MIFLKRAGTIILLSTTVILWVLLSFLSKSRPSIAAETDGRILESAGRIGERRSRCVVKPIGFNHDISRSRLPPAMAAREVAVVGARHHLRDRRQGDDTEAAPTRSVGPKIAKARWTLPTALAFLMWFVFAPQCLSTIAVTRRETNGWKWPLFMVGYLFAAAYIMVGITYWLAVLAGL